MRTDTPGLGNNPALNSMDRAYVRQALSFLDRESTADVDRAGRYLLRRAAEFYDVIDYVGPYLTRDRLKLELPQAKCEFYGEAEYANERVCLAYSDHHHRGQLSRIYNEARAVSFDMALLLAAWEAAQEVPESEQVLRRGVWLAYHCITANVSRPWGEIRRRAGTNTMRQEIRRIVELLPSMAFAIGRHGRGEYIQMARQAA